MREYSATVGASDGNIIAAIITTHTPRNQPSVPSAVHGPSSMPRIRSAVDHHPTAASDEEERDETEARTYGRERRRRGRRPASGAEAISAPRRTRDVESPVLPSYSIPNALICERLASAIVRSDPTGWNMPANRTGSPVSTPNGTMSSISKSIASPTRTP